MVGVKIWEISKVITKNRKEHKELYRILKSLINKDNFRKYKELLSNYFVCKKLYEIYLNYTKDNKELFNKILMQNEFLEMMKKYNELTNRKREISLKLIYKLSHFVY